MAIHGGTHFVITGSFTDTGAPAYLGADGRWVADLASAALIATDAERDERLTRALPHERDVCDAYGIDVRLDGTSIDPISTRERIRAQGHPTVRLRRPD